MTQRGLLKNTSGNTLVEGQSKFVAQKQSVSTVINGGQDYPVMTSKDYF